MTIDLNSLLNLAMLVGLVLVLLVGVRLYRFGRTGKSGPAPARRGEVRNLPFPGDPSRKEPRALRCRP